LRGQQASAKLNKTLDLIDSPSAIAPNICAAALGLTEFDHYSRGIARFVAGLLVRSRRGIQSGPLEFGYWSWVDAGDALAAFRE